jgi:hypothetical protein
VTGLGGGTRYLAGLLEDSGWSRDRVDRAFHGRPLRTFFEQHVPVFGAVANAGRTWLTGGWLDDATAIPIGADLERDDRTIRASIRSSAARQATATGLDPAWLEGNLEAGLTDLRSMLSQASNDTLLWVIED